MSYRVEGKEIKNIDGFEGLYAIDRDGFIWAFPKFRSHRSKKGNIFSVLYNGKWLKRKINEKDGYVYINLHKNGSAFTRKIHRLVAETFIPNPHQKKEVNHRNGNKLDNSVENLEWVTPSENQQHAIRMGLRRVGDKCPYTKISDSNVKKIRSLYNSNKISQLKIANLFEISQSHVWRIIHGTRRKHLWDTK